MTDPDFSFITPDVQLDQVPPLDHKRVIAFVNHFIIRSVHMLNTFASNAEKKIFDIETRIGRLSIELQLLELKLDSIPGIATVEDKPVEKQKEVLNVKETTEATLDTVKDRPVVENFSTDNSDHGNNLVVTEASQSTTKEHFSEEKQVKYRDDPRYAKYFKMLRLGVVEAAVKQKMANDGFDPNILSKPDEISEQRVISDLGISKLENKDDTSNSDDLSSDYD
uniref:WASH complex subunit CCDC53 n=1 Tax=Syphacia muris TaxID=451379 RepID=A0A0N5AK76_9BILA